MTWLAQLASTDPATAYSALQTGAIVCPVSPAGLLRFSGEETQAFLHGQLSSDVKALSENQAQYSSYSTPKGRMQASFLLFRQGGDYWLQLADELAPPLQKRLSMFILRSKTRGTDASAEHALIGIAGPQAASLIQQTTGIADLPTLGVQDTADGCVIALPGGRFQLLTTQESAAGITQRLLAAGGTPALSDAWRLTDIHAGIPWVTAATQEEFVLQMANLDLIGGVSFNKGCYPGQEIVARTRYLGKLKRRMYRAQITAESVTAGQDVFSPEMNGQPSGKILQSAPSGNGGHEALVITQISSLEHGLHLGELTGPSLEILPLPYPVE